MKPRNFPNRKAQRRRNALEHLEGHTDYIPPPNWPFADE